MKLPLGHSDFKKIIEGHYECVDKTLFIKAVLDEDAESFLITRFRRSGKTFNMSMLYYFFSLQDKEKNRTLFKGLKIETAVTKENESCMQFQGNFPVIFFTLKNIRAKSYKSALRMLTNTVRKVYQQHAYLLQSDKLTSCDKKIFETILDASASEENLQFSLYNLSEYLSKYYNERVLILLDEYDTPFHSAYTNIKGDYHTELAEFMSQFLGIALKENPYLWKGIMTGILRMSLANLFSGANNVMVRSMTSYKYADCFGFTEEEVNNLFEKAGLTFELNEIKNWYNGYKIADITLYNPWSIMNCLDNNGIVDSYWQMSGEDGVLGKALRHASFKMLEQLRTLLSRETIVVRLNEQAVFKDISRDERALWGMLLATGYLNVTNTYLKERHRHYSLKIPNKEIEYAYESMIENWFNRQICNFNQTLLDSLLRPDMKMFGEQLQAYLEESVSYFDLGRNTCEKFYHVMVLGMFIWLRDKYLVKSNKEAGIGRYDIVLIPLPDYKHQLTAMIFEFKACQQVEELEKSVDIALHQMIEKFYYRELTQHGINSGLHVGIAFCGKSLHLRDEQCDYTQLQKTSSDEDTEAMATIARSTSKRVHTELKGSLHQSTTSLFYSTSLSTSTASDTSEPVMKRKKINKTSTEETDSSSASPSSSPT